MHTQRDLERDIQKMGVVNTDVLTVHTSLKAIGKIDDHEKSGAEVVLDALRGCVSDGILMIPSHTYNNIRDNPVFDIRNTAPCIGTLPRVAVEYANRAYDAGDVTCIRSRQVSHSVVVFGKKAHAFAQADRDARTRSSIKGCYGNLYRQNGKILLLGVGLDRNTFIHMVDEYLDYDVGGAIPDPPDRICATDYDGSVWEQVFSVTHGPSSSTFVRYENALNEAGAVAYGKVGDADSMLVDARKCFDVVLKIRKSEKK